MLRFNHIVYFAFLCLISIPLFDEIVSFLPLNVNSENRDLGTAQSSKNPILSFKNYLDHFDENFHGRSLMVHQYIDYKNQILGDSPLPNKLLKGKNGMWFLVDYNSMDDYRNVQHFSRQELDSLTQILLQNKAFLEEKNIPYLIVIVPEKQRIYPENLPDNISQIQTSSRLEAFKNYLRQRDVSLPIIDLNKVLLEAKKEEKELLYFKEESHWNYMGAKIGFDTVSRYLNEKWNYRVLPVDYRNILHAEDDIDLAKMLGKSIQYTESTLKPVPSHPIEIKNYPIPFSVVSYKLSKKPNYVINKYNPKGKGSVFLFRDSYSALWEEYFFHSFQKTTLVWQYPFDKRMIEQSKPDVVIHEIAERHLDILLLK